MDGKSVNAATCDGANGWVKNTGADYFGKWCQSGDCTSHPRRAATVRYVSSANAPSGCRFFVLSDFAPPIDHCTNELGNWEIVCMGKTLSKLIVSLLCARRGDVRRCCLCLRQRSASRVQQRPKLWHKVMQRWRLRLGYVLRQYRASVSCLLLSERGIVARCSSGKGLKSW